MGSGRLHTLLTTRIQIGLLGTAIFIIGAATLFAQSNSATPEQPAPVQLDGRTIFYVRTTIKSSTPEARARGIAERIRRLAADPFFRSDTITVSNTDITTDVTADEVIVTMVFDADAQAEGRGRQELAAERAEQIRNAIRQYGVDHSTHNVVKASGFALLTTVIFLVLLFLIQKTYRFSRSRLTAWIEKDSRVLLRKYAIPRSQQIEAAMLAFLKLPRGIAILVVVYLYVGAVFSFFPGTRDVAGQLLSYVTGPLNVMYQAVRLQIPKLFFLLVLVVVTRYVLKLLHVIFRAIEAGTIKIDGFFHEWAFPTYRLVKILVIIFAVTVAYPYIPGSSSEAFKGISLFLGLLVSLGSGSFVGNIIAGLTMTYMRAFKIGDRVKIEDFTCDVVETSMQVTHFQTPKNEIISVPNLKIINSHVINYSALAHEKGLILHTTVGVGYNAPWRQVRAMLLLAAEETSGVLKEPVPFVLLKSLGDFCVTYELNAYTDQAHFMAIVYSELHKNILDKFNEYQVQIMTPSYEGDRDAPAIVQKDKWYTAPADRFNDDERPLVESQPGEAHPEFAGR
jgi:small-conductance mechanosensitive channel